MSRAATRSFRSGDSEAVLLPEAVAYGRDIDLIAERSGDVVILRPVTAAPADGRRRVAALIAAMDAVGPVGEIEQRVPFLFSDRGGV